MAKKKASTIEELSERLDLTMERLATLEDAVENNPEFEKLAPYLRIAIASLRTGIELYGESLDLTINAKKLQPELKSEG